MKEIQTPPEAIAVIIDPASMPQALCSRTPSPVLYTQACEMNACGALVTYLGHALPGAYSHWQTSYRDGSAPQVKLPPPPPT